MRVVAAVAMSADGFVSPAVSMRSFDWTSKEDRRHIVRLSKEMDAIVMGKTTFNTFKVKQAPPGRRLLVYTNDPLSVTGTNVETTNKPPQELLAQLEAEGATRVIIEGGTTVYSMFLAASVVDEVYITIEPVLLGHGVPFLHTDLGIRMRLLESSMLNDNTILLHYAIQK